MNLYGFVGNDAVNVVDNLGLVFDGTNDLRDIANMNPGEFDSVFVGPHATFFTQAKNPFRTTRAERAFVNEIGICHTSGVTGVPMNGDHQPSNKLNPYGETVYIYPQAYTVSDAQGNKVAQLRWLGSTAAEYRIQQQMQSQAALGAAMAIAMAIQEYGNWLDEKTNDIVTEQWAQMVEAALAQCRARKEQAPPGMAKCGGCCQITVFFRWQEPGERLWFGQYKAPSGRRYPTSSVGDYSVRNCSDRPNDYLVDNPDANGYQIIRVKL